VDSKPSWQSTVVGVAFIAAVTAIFIVVVAKDGIDAGLKAWAAIGTVVGVITGVVPTYFFSKSAASTAQQSAKSAHDELDQERRRRADAEQKVLTLLNIDPTLKTQAQAKRPDLFT
jgi:Na+/glutamate symporter